MQPNNESILDDLPAQTTAIFAASIFWRADRSAPFPDASAIFRMGGCREQVFSETLPERCSAALDFPRFFELLKFSISPEAFAALCSIPLKSSRKLFETMKKNREKQKKYPQNLWGGGFFSYICGVKIIADTQDSDVPNSGSHLLFGQPYFWRARFFRLVFLR